MVGLKAHYKDNVATIFQEVKQGDLLQINDPRGTTASLTANQDIPYGHKIALSEIHPGEAIIKYGEELGKATMEIAAGDYVHVHNLNSARGRGDINENGGEA